MFWVLFAAVLPAFVLLTFIYNKDKYQKEPTGQILKGFLYGIGSAFIVLLLPAFGLLGTETESTAISAQISKAFSTAAIPEETAKLFMLWLLLRKNKYFDERMDGIVYAAAVGMGFAATENILYLFSDLNNWVTVGIVRALISVPGHFFFAVCMGYYYSLAHFKMTPYKLKDSICVLLVPVIAHGIFDALLFISDMTPMLSGAVTLLFLIGFLYLKKFASSRIAVLLEADRKAMQKFYYIMEDGAVEPDEQSGQ